MNTINTLNELLDQAIKCKSSDIHIEPQEENSRVRFRTDGILNEINSLSKDAHLQIVSRIKVISHLDIAEKRLPQDGRIQYQKMDLRISIIPTCHGEKCVIRILNREHSLLSLENLGMQKEHLTLYHKMLQRKTGILLVTGPTGSGKTTTLYASLNILNSSEVNISTIEDPIEYKLPGINQIQVNYKTGLTFSRGLRSILRQDPDIIMIGEIRDEETAKIAIQSALTGHLVLSTLHTNDAVSAITRLKDIGIPNFLINATLIGVVAQRLARKPQGGRIGIFEMFMVENNLQEAISQNFKTLAEDGKEKIKLGLTTKEELWRII